MHHINGVYTQRIISREKRMAHFFGGGTKQYWPMPIAIFYNSAATYTETLLKLAHRWSNVLMITIGQTVGKVVAPAWLTQDTIHEELRTKAAYRRFVEQGLDEETTRFYGKHSSLLSEFVYNKWLNPIDVKMHLLVNSNVKGPSCFNAHTVKIKE